jgi:hypothetical protein
MFRTALFCVALSTAILVPGSVQAQGRKPLSPPAETSVSFAGRNISVKYSAPSMRGRKIFGELVPFGKVWRAGANAATAFHTEADLDLNGLSVPKGDYTLYVLPEPDQWTLIVNGQTGQWGLTYNQSQDLGRVKMNMSKPSAPVETFKITLAQSGNSAGKLQMEWEGTVASVPFKVK